MIDSAGTLGSLSTRLATANAKNIYFCASHGLFTELASEIIDHSPVTKVVVSNTLPLPNKGLSKKIEQISIAPLLGHAIITEHFRAVTFEVEEFEIEE